MFFERVNGKFWFKLALSPLRNAMWKTPDKVFAIELDSGIS